jgi:hypothetical protein
MTSNAEEDLTIMARILDKAARGAHDDDKVMAMNIAVDAAVFGSSSGARNIYLEGYGALFLMSVRYPLLASPEKPEEAKAKENTSTDWETAREDVFGSTRTAFDVDFDRIWRSSSRLREEFDADKVEDLKSSLIEALKNATHIRALKPNDYVTIVVHGAESVRSQIMKMGLNEPVGESRKGSGSYAATVIGPAKVGETMMTIRVKKSDVDAFAKGQMDLEAFRKKTSVQVYLRRTSATSSSPFLMPSRQVR